jgi:uncharacterized membrane-anchored protein YhcB (DUF1043 family)
MAVFKQNKPEDKEQFAMTVGNKIYTDRKEAGAAIISMCKEIKGINASADVGEYLGFKLNVTFDSFNNKFILNVKGAMSHPMEVGADAGGNITRINNVLEAMPNQLEEAQTKYANVEKQLETAKVEVNKPFAQEAELAEKMDRLAALNALLNMDEKGDSAAALDDEPTSRDATGQNVQKPLPEQESDTTGHNVQRSEPGTENRPEARASLKERLESMKGRVSEASKGKDAIDRTKSKQETL